MRSLRLRSELWRDRGFVRLWAANAVSQLGTQVTLLALPLAALYVLKASALGVALLRSFAFLPFLLFSLPAGVWVDRLRRRPLMIAADLGRAAAMASIPLAYWLGHLTMAQLYVVAGVHGLLSVVFDVSYLSFLPTLIGRERLGEANSKLLGTQSVGAARRADARRRARLGVRRAVAILADAVSFLLSGSFVTAIRGREARPEPTRTRARTELAEGLRYVFSQPYLRTLTIWISVGNLFTSALFALFDRLLRARPPSRRGDDRLGHRRDQPRLHRGRVRQRRARPPLRRRADDRVHRHPLLGRARRDPGRAAARSPLPVLVAQRPRRHVPRLLHERQPADAPAGDHAAPPARPDERGHPLHVLGDDAARLGARRRRRRDGRPARTTLFAAVAAAAS